MTRCDHLELNQQIQHYIKLFQVHAEPDDYLTNQTEEEPPRPRVNFLKYFWQDNFTYGMLNYGYRSISQGIKSQQAHLLLGSIQRSFKFNMSALYSSEAILLNVSL